MYLRLISISAFVLSILLFSSCKTAEVQQHRVIRPAEWPTSSWTQNQYKNYFDSSLTKFPLEGIWTLKESFTWKNPTQNVSGMLRPSNIYRLAIVHDSTLHNYDYYAVLLESDDTNWTPGSLKGYLRRTAYSDYYEYLFFDENFESEKGFLPKDDNNWAYNTSQLIYNELGLNIETSKYLVLFKVYPPFDRIGNPADTSLKGTGSGFLISKSGLIVTNHHVIENMNKIEVVFPEKNIKKSGTIKLVDNKNDLAIIQLNDFKYSEISDSDIPYSIADFKSVKVGQEVFTLGFPVSDVLGSECSRLSIGNISSMYGLTENPVLMQISAPIQPGNSGGPVFNTKGEIAGVIVSSLNSSAFWNAKGTMPQNVNFAIKSLYLQSLISMLSEGNELKESKTDKKKDSIENLVEKFKPFIVQIKIY